MFSIVMEYADNGDLFQKILEHQKKGQLMNENEIWNILIQVKIAVISLKTFNFLIISTDS